MECEAMLKQQRRKEEQRFRDSNEIINRYATKLDRDEIAEMRRELNECRIKHHRISSNEKKETLTSDLKQLCDSSKIELGDNHIKAVTRYRDYRKRLIVLKTCFEQHCDCFSKFIEEDMERMESKFEEIFVSSEKNVKDRKPDHEFHGFTRLF